MLFFDSKRLSTTILLADWILCFKDLAMEKSLWGKWKKPHMTSSATKAGSCVYGNIVQGCMSSNSFTYAYKGQLPVCAPTSKPFTMTVLRATLPAPWTNGPCTLSSQSYPSSGSFRLPLPCQLQGRSRCDLDKKKRKKIRISPVTDLIVQDFWTCF